MSERRFKVSKSEESNHYRYSDLTDDDRAKEKLLPSNDRIIIQPSETGMSINRIDEAASAEVRTA